MEEILKAFAAAGCTLESYVSDGVTYYAFNQFPFGPASFEMYEAVNGLGLPGIFATYDNAEDKGGWGLTCCKRDWLAEFVECIPLMLRGENLPW